MNIDPGLLNTLVAVLGSALLAGLGFVLRTLNQQTKALAVLVARVDPAITNVSKTAAIEATVNVHTSEIKDIQADLSRIWGIYDGYKTTTAAQHP